MSWWYFHDLMYFFVTYDLQIYIIKSKFPLINSSSDNTDSLIRSFCSYIVLKGLAEMGHDLNASKFTAEFAKTAF